MGGREKTLLRAIRLSAVGFPRNTDYRKNKMKLIHLDKDANQRRQPDPFPKPKIFCNNYV